MSTVWVPLESAQLRHLQKALSPHVARFTQTYLPIRNKIYAHRFITDEEAFASLFPLTNRSELGEMIDFLQDLIKVIYDLYYNGWEPVLGKRDLTQTKEEARRSVEKVLRKLAIVARQTES